MSAAREHPEFAHRAASFMSKIATCAPAAASRSAETLPMPLAPPVTSATLPWKAIGILL